MDAAAAALLQFVTDQFARVHAKLDRLVDAMNGLKARGAASEGEAASLRVELAEINARLERIDLRLDRLERPSASFPSF
jgi:hypothetical protein